MVGTTYRNLGRLRLREGRPIEARRALEQALASYNEHFREQNAFIPRTQRFLARALLESGDPEAAAALADDVLVRLRELGLNRHPAVVDALETAGLARLAAGQRAEGAGLLREALVLREASSVPSDPAIARLRRQLDQQRALVEVSDGARSPSSRRPAAEPRTRSLRPDRPPVP